jgi:hypothetical protein
LETYRDAPRLRPEQVRNARLLSSREELLPLLPPNIVFVEVGVALGDFTEAVLNMCQVSKFYALDMFDMQRWPETWDGRVGRELAGLSHLEYYKNKFST